MKNLETYIEYLRTFIKMKKRKIEAMDSRDNQYLSYQRVGSMLAYDTILKELEETEALMVKENKNEQ